MWNYSLHLDFGLTVVENPNCHGMTSCNYIGRFKILENISLAFMAEEEVLSKQAVNDAQSVAHWESRLCWSRCLVEESVVFAFVLMVFGITLVTSWKQERFCT